VQIFLWLFGVRVELFGTSADEPTISTVKQNRDRYADHELEDRKRRWEHEKVYFELKKEQLERELEIAELESTIAELRSKVEQAAAGKKP
jgi:hypothetical protein